MNDTPATPQHDAYRPHQEQGQAIGEFLEWLQHTKHFVIAEYLIDEPTFVDEMVHANYDVNRLLAEFFGIDYDAYQAEKEAVYRCVSARAAAQLESP